MKETKFKNTEIGKIPEEWKMYSIGKDCSVKARIGWQGLTTSEYLQTGHYGLITSTDLIEGKVNWDTCVFVSEERYKQDTNIIVKNGDVLVSKDGTIGKVAVVSNLQYPTALNSGVFVIRTKNKKITQEGLGLVFISPYFKDFIKRLTAGSTIVHLYQKDIVNFTFPIPTLPEQHRIASALTSIDNLISSLGKLIEKKKNIKQGTMQQLLTGKTRLKGFNEPWMEKKLGDIGSLAMCKRIFQEETSEKGDVPFYKIGTFGQQADAYITKGKYEQFKQMYRFPQKGDVLISAAGTIGRTVIYNGEPAYFQDSNIVWLAHNGKYITNNFLFYIYQRTDWNTEDTTIARLYNNNFNNTCIHFPSSITEQQAIANILSKMDNEITALETKKAKYEAIKQGMMQQLLTGKIRLIS